MVKPIDTMGPPVAKRYAHFKAGTPSRALHDRLKEMFPDNLEPLFRQVGEEAGVKPDTASGSLYGFLNGRRSLPASHRRAYVNAGVPEGLIAAVELARPTGRRPLAGQAVEQQTVDDRLGGLANDVASLLEWREQARKEIRSLRSRIRTLERQPARAAAAPKGR